MKRLYTILFLLLSTFAFADQTFDQETAILDEVYYDVPFEVTITEQNSPTDFYVSVGTALTGWEQVSATYGWGEFNPTATLELTLDDLYTNVELGIHTGVRNSGTFSDDPTDVSDQIFSVNPGSITFTGPSEIWYDDIFYFSWKIDESTLPDRLVFEYNTVSGWEVIDTISIKESEGITFHNESVEGDADFRLTYLGNAYGYPLGEVESEFLDYEFEIVNRDDIESKLWDDEEIVTIELRKERLSEYTYVTAVVDGEVIDSIGSSQTYTTVTTPRKQDAVTTVEFYTEWGEFITDISIESEHKFFEVSPLTDNEYKVSETIPFTWSYSDHFDLVTASVLRNSNTMGSEILNDDWELSRAYNYSAVETDTTLLFCFTVTDGHTTITRETRLVIIGGHCREAELEAEIRDLQEELSDARATINILRAQVDSLEIFISEIEPDYVFVTLIKDIPNSIETEYENVYSETETLVITDGRGDLGVDGLTHVYIVDTIGRTYDAQWNDRYLYVDGLQENAYFVVAIDAAGNIYTYKFVI